MNTKNLSIFRLFLAAAILTILAGLWQPAGARSGIYPLVKGQTIGLGRQGLYISNIPLGVSQVLLDNVGTNIPAQFNYKMKMPYRAPAMEVRFQNERGGEVSQISALVYVFFNIGRAERDLWLAGGMDNIAIWYANLRTGNWELCHTYFVNKTDANQLYGRLACLAPGSGYFVLADATRAPASVTNQAQNSAASDMTTLKVRAYIDGLSHLVIRDDTVYWHHLESAAPGRYPNGGTFQPTYLNTTQWEPSWLDVPDAENRDCNCTSASYLGIPPLAHSSQQVRLAMVQGRGSASILQKPSEANNYTLIVELNDGNQDGADWYEINLTYQEGPDF